MASSDPGISRCIKEFTEDETQSHHFQTRVKRALPGLQRFQKSVAGFSRLTEAPTGGKIIADRPGSGGAMTRATSSSDPGISRCIKEFTEDETQSHHLQTRVKRALPGLPQSCGKIFSVNNLIVILCGWRSL